MVLMVSKLGGNSQRANVLASSLIQTAAIVYTYALREKRRKCELYISKGSQLQLIRHNVYSKTSSSFSKVPTST